MDRHYVGVSHVPTLIYLVHCSLTFTLSLFSIREKKKKHHFSLYPGYLSVIPNPFHFQGYKLVQIVEGVSPKNDKHLAFHRILTTQAFFNSCTTFHMLQYRKIHPKSCHVFMQAYTVGLHVIASGRPAVFHNILHVLHISPFYMHSYRYKNHSNLRNMKVFCIIVKRLHERLEI